MVASRPDAVTAASAGDRLSVYGVCTGTTVIGTNLTISGPSAQKSATLQTGHNGGVLAIDSGATVTINRLIIADGSAVNGGGIANSGTLILNNSSIAGNFADAGAGVFNSGTVTLNSTSVTGNGGPTTSVGGGIYNSGTVTLNGTTAIAGNRALQFGGILNEGGTVTGATATNIISNTPTNCYAVPGCVG